MFKCDKCNAELEENAKFCINCGEKIDDKVFTIIEEKKDVSLWFLPLGLLIGFIFEFYTKKIELGANDISFFQFISIIFDKAPAELYAEILGAALAKMLIPTIIIGFIWGIKLIISKKYEKPVLHIFVGTLIITVLAAIGTKDLTKYKIQESNPFDTAKDILTSLKNQIPKKINENTTLLKLDINGDHVAFEYYINNASIDIMTPESQNIFVYTVKKELCKTPTFIKVMEHSYNIDIKYLDKNYNTIGKVQLSKNECK
jgi:hypothetical protein